MMRFVINLFPYLSDSRWVDVVCESFFFRFLILRKERPMMENREKTQRKIFNSARAQNKKTQQLKAAKCSSNFESTLIFPFRVTSRNFHLWWQKARKKKLKNSQIVFNHLSSRLSVRHLFIYLLFSSDLRYSFERFKCWIVTDFFDMKMN